MLFYFYVVDSPRAGTSRDLLGDPHDPVDVALAGLEASSTPGKGR